MRCLAVRDWNPFSPLQVHLQTCSLKIDHPGALIEDSGVLLQLLCQLSIPMTLFINYERFIPHLLLHKRIHAFILQHDLLTRHHALRGKLNFWRLENLRKFHRFNETGEHQRV